MNKSTLIITSNSKYLKNYTIGISYNFLYLSFIFFTALTLFSYFVYKNQNKLLIPAKNYAYALSENQMLKAKTRIIDNFTDSMTYRLLGKNKDIDLLNTFTSLSESDHELLINDNYRQASLEKEIIGSRLTKYKIKIGNRTLFDYFVDNENKEQRLETEQKIYDVKNNIQQVLNNYDFNKNISLCNVGDEEFIGLIDNIMVFFVTKQDAMKNNMEAPELAEKYQRQLQRELKIAKDNSFLQGNPILRKITVARRNPSIAEMSKSIARKQTFISNVLKEDSVRIADVYGKTVQMQANYARTPSTYPLLYNFITSPYGFRVHPVTGRYILHTGMDFSALIGTRIKSTADGYVSYAGWMYGYGNLIVVNHGFGISTMYAHCSQIYVRRGQRIKKNTTIGLTGNSGLVAGPHLHYEIRKNNMSIDPAPYLNRDILTAKKEW